MVFERLIISKLIHGYKPLEAKNGDNFVEKKMLLFVANFAIDDLSTQ